MKIIRFIVLGFLLIIIIFSILEFGSRLFKKSQQNDAFFSLDSERVGLDMEDEQLFWKMRPNVNIIWQGVNIKTNSLGLRDTEVSSDKKDNVFRILSLGESTTFGAKVEFDEIYSEVLERRLNEMKSDYTFEVINAGVSAYTSFQSLVYLKKEGLKLKPDMILIYHEYNDSLPTTLRNRKYALAQITLTDRQLYKLRNYFGGLLYYLNKSELYKLMKKYIVRLRISLLEKSAETMEKDLPNFNSVDTKIKCRVSLEDKRQIFKELLEISKQNNIHLIIIHPIYRITVKHQCFLTEFSAQNNIPLIETFGAFQDSGYSKDELFYDNMHPTALGHKIIADCIFKYIETLLVQPREKVGHSIQY